MCVQDATNNQDVSSKGDCAPNIEASNQSKPKLKLLCNPQRLPKPTIPKPTKKTATSESKRIIRDFFWDKFAKSEKRARERKWI